MTESERYIHRQTARRVIVVAKADLDEFIGELRMDSGDYSVDVVKLESISRALDNAINSLIGT